jgi:transcriptional regulator with XRE-family HTH domain
MGSQEEKALRKVISPSAVAEPDNEPLSFRRRTVVIEGPDPIDKYVGGQLRLRRAQIGMTQSELGGKLGLSFQALQKYETGENRISASRLFQLARLLDVSMGYFFEGLDETGRVEDEVGSSELARKEASMVLGAYYSIKDPRVRSACLMIMARLSGPASEDIE